MYRKKVSHPIYGTFYVEEEDFLDFHRTLAGLSRLEEAAADLASHGVEIEDMEPGFIKIRDDGEERFFYKIVDDSSGKEMTLGLTQDEDRFPLYPRDDGFWKPSDGKEDRPEGSKSRRGEPSRGEESRENGQSGGGSSTTTTHEKLSMSPSRSAEADTIQKIRNAKQQWAMNILDEDHQKAIWRHCQRIRADDPEEVLMEALDEVGASDLTITYATAEKVIQMIENPSLLEGEGEIRFDPQDELPF